MLIDYNKNGATGIYALDSGYHRPLMAAIHFIVDSGRVAIVDTASNDSLPRVEAALAELGLGPEAVDWVVLTHIHLDHAGGAGAYLRRFANARLVVHPKGARHMADPIKLMAGVEAVYGKDEARRLYGELVPIDPARIDEGGEGHAFMLGARRLVCLDTPGHARHHLSLWDETGKAVFTGDTFGFSYREFDVDGRPFIFPTTSPVAFEPDAMHESVSRIAALGAEGAYLTHYSQVTDLPARAATLHRLIDAHVASARAHAGAGADREARILADLQALTLDELRAHGSTLSAERSLELMGVDLRLNAQGLVVWLDGEAKRAAQAAATTSAPVAA
jgi:hydroxyacylglutathione hydrolase